MKVTMERLHFALSLLIRGSLLFAVIVSIINKAWIALFTASIVLLLTFLPALIERNFELALPVELEIVVLIFIYATLFLGEMHGYYTRYWWWDVVLHASSAIVFGLIGFVIVYILSYAPTVELKMSPNFIALFSFVFALALGAMWEIVEFFLDIAFGWNMQRSGLVDTMWDLIVDMTGAMIAGLAGYFYVKYGDVLIFGKPIKRFVKENPKFFKKAQKTK